MTIVEALARVLSREHPGTHVQVDGDQLTAVITYRHSDVELAEPLTVRAWEADLLPGLARNEQMLARSWPRLSLEEACAEMLGVNVDEILITQRPGEVELTLGDKPHPRPAPVPSPGRDDQRLGWRIVGSVSGEEFDPGRS